MPWVPSQRVINFKIKVLDTQKYRFIGVWLKITLNESRLIKTVFYE